MQDIYQEISQQTETKNSLDKNKTSLGPHSMGCHHFLRLPTDRAHYFLGTRQERCPEKLPDVDVGPVQHQRSVPPSCSRFLWQLRCDCWLSIWLHSGKCLAGVRSSPSKAGHRKERYVGFLFLDIKSALLLLLYHKKLSFSHLLLQIAGEASSTECSSTSAFWPFAPSSSPLCGSSSTAFICLLGAWHCTPYETH